MPERELFDTIFEASYDPGLTGAGEGKLKSRIRARLRKLTYGIDRTLPADKLVEEIDDRIYGCLKQKEGTLLSVEFAVKGEGNCIVYSDLVLLALDRLGRKDAAENLWVKTVPGHVWLEYEDGVSPTFSINAQGCSSDRRHTLEALLASNWNAKGVHLEAFRDCDNAMKCYDRAIGLDSEHRNAWFNKGTLMYDMARYGDAIACFDKVLGIDAQDRDALHYKSLALKESALNDSANPTKTL